MISSVVTRRVRCLLAGVCSVCGLTDVHRHFFTECRVTTPFAPHPICVRTDIRTGGAKVISIPNINLDPGTVENLLDRIDDAARRGVGLQLLARNIGRILEQAATVTRSARHQKLAVTLNLVLTALQSREFVSARYVSDRRGRILQPRI